MKKKIVMYIFSTIIFIIILVSILLTMIFQHQQESSIENYLKLNNNFLKNVITDNKYNIDKVSKEENEKRTLRITYIDKNGTVTYDSEFDVRKLSNHNSREEIITARKNGEGFSIRRSDSEKKTMIYYATLMGNGEVIRSAVGIESISFLKSNYFKYYIIGLIIIIFLSIWLSNKLSFIIVKPIKDLDFITSRIAKGEIHKRVNVVTDDEVGKLGSNFNYMTERLEATIYETIDKQNKLEAILKCMDSGVIAIDRNYKVIMINPYAERIFGINKNIIGENFLDNVRDFELEKILLSSDKEPKEIKIMWPLERELRIKTTDIINKNEHIGTVAVVQDITDIKKLENMRSQFVANVSHELKTPLTSIKGFAETLKDVDDLETRNKFLTIINDESERLTRLINDILILSHIEQQKELKHEEVNVNKIILDVYNLMKNMAQNKNISLSMVGEEIPNLKGDSDKFKQMVINIIDNAIKYTEKGGTVTVSTEKIQNKCIIWVKDTGVGISKEQIPRLFERFYRVDKARSRENGGTGLGLAIVKHIVILFKGAIDVESELGVGTKFIIRIPYEN